MQGPYNRLQIARLTVKEPVDECGKTCTVLVSNVYVVLEFSRKISDKG